MSKFAQALLSDRSRKRGVCHQELDIPVQVDRAMHVRFDLGVEHATRLAIRRCPPRLGEFADDVHEASDREVRNSERGREKWWPRRGGHNVQLTFCGHVAYPLTQLSQFSLS